RTEEKRVNKDKEKEKNPDNSERPNLTEKPRDEGKEDNKTKRPQQEKEIQKKTLNELLSRTPKSDQPNEKIIGEWDGIKRDLKEWQGTSGNNCSEQIRNKILEIDREIENL